MIKAKARKAPWRTTNPRKRAGTSKTLSPAQKATARRAAAKAGRPYPNLVDNMRVAAKGKVKRKTAAKKKAGSTNARRAKSK